MTIDWDAFAEIAKELLSKFVCGPDDIEMSEILPIDDDVKEFVREFHDRQNEWLLK